jgi:uncharacterized protein YcbK (DUF882 family)
MVELNRRRMILKTAAFAAASLSASSLPALAGVNDKDKNKVIRLYNPNNRERLRAVFWRDGWFDARAMDDINHFMRDWRQDQQVNFDPYVVGLLHSICQECGHAGEVVILSGYRTKATNDWLRNHPRYSAAKDSLHLYGRAADFTFPSTSLRKVKDAARKFQQGGVGYYPKQHFVHIDTGEERYWTG